MTTDCTAQLLNANLKKSWYKQAFLMTYLHPLINPLADHTLPNASVSKYIKLAKTDQSSDAIINKLTVSPDVMTFFEGRPIDYSQLVPHIEIYKVYLKNRQTVSEVLFPFKAYTNFNEEWAPENLLAAPFRGREAGLQSVDLKMDGAGKNPFSANIMSVSIKLVFNDVKTLFAEWMSPEGFSVQYADLIRYPPGSLSADTDPRALPAAFRIRLSVGWNANPNNPIFKEKRGGEDFFNAVRNSRMNFIGDMYTHTMDFLEDGSVAITIQYKGALEGAMSNVNADLMNSYSLDDNGEIRQLKAELNKVELTHWEAAARNAKGARAKRFQDLLKQKDTLLQLKATNKAIDKAQERVENSGETFASVGDAKSKDYTALQASAKKANFTNQFTSNLESLRGIARQLPARQISSEQYQAQEEARVNKSLRQLAPGIDEGGAKKYKEALQKEQEKIKAKLRVLEATIRSRNLYVFVKELLNNDRVMWLDTTKESAFQNYLKYQKEIQEGGVESEGDAAEEQLIINSIQSDWGVVNKSDAEAANTKVKETLGTQTEVITSGSDKKTSIPTRFFLADDYTPGEKIMFFTLGDLISTILKHNNFGEGIEQLAPNFRIIFGIMEYTPPGRTNVLISSLYYLPISLEIFVNFLAKKIVGEGKKAYPLMLFLRDLIKFVMSNVISTAGSGPGGAMLEAVNGKRQKFELDITSIDLPTRLVESKLTKKGHHKNPTLDLNGKNKQFLRTFKKLPINKISNVFLLHAKNSEPFKQRIKSTLSANLLEDRVEGIFHFMVGGPNRGLLKKVTFTENTDALFATAMWRKAAGSGTDSERGVIKPAKFSCELTLIGNPYFYIGQYFYINTDLISGGHFSKELIMNGGYYYVIGVDTYFTSSKWETKVKGVLTIADTAIRNGSLYKPLTLTKDQSSEYQVHLAARVRELEQKRAEALAGLPDFAKYPIVIKF